MHVPDRLVSRVSCVIKTGELKEAQIETIKTILSNPGQFNIPDWFLNRQKVRSPPVAASHRITSLTAARRD